jgi:predicted DNA-binding transcriptional regulator AlpA
MEVLMLTPAQVAALLGITTQTLWRWGKRDDGPPYVGNGRTRRYRHDEVQEWIAARAGGKQAS